VIFSATGALTARSVVLDRSDGRASISLNVEERDQVVRALTARSALTTMPPPRSSTHRLFGPLPGTAHTSFTLESCLGDWISVDETRCVPSPRHQHPMVARPTENFATNVRVVRTQLQDRAAKSEVRIAASHRQGAGKSSSSRGNCLANCSTEEFAPVEWPLHAAPRRIALSTSCPMRRTTEGDDIARSQTDCGTDDDGSRIRCESRNLTVAA
jgi:hypothetical protein